MKLDITDNQWLAFVMTVVGSLIAWYSAVLLSESGSHAPFGKPKVTERQIFGIIFYLTAGLVFWGKMIFVFGEVKKKKI